MCGIFALFNNNNTFTKDIIKFSFERSVNRGPEHSTLEICDNKLLIGFHRLAINGLTSISNQPITIGSYKLICNGEIYNYKSLFSSINVTPTTNSDCEIIIHLYKLYGMEYTLRLLDGVYSFILYDYNGSHLEPIVYIARDPFGVRPLYVLEPTTEHKFVTTQSDNINITSENILGFASELKALSPLLNVSQRLLHFGISKKMSTTAATTSQEIIPYNIQQFPAGCYMSLSCSFKSQSSWNTVFAPKKFYMPLQTPRIISSYDKTFELRTQTMLCTLLNAAVKKRVVDTSDRPIACLLSGGLDSSLITALVQKYYTDVLETYSIGMAGSEDLIRAKQVANYLGTKHTEVILTKDELFKAIPETIYAIESYDTTTVRASVGNYLLGKYISKHSEAKVIFNGDGSDELTGGYLYFLKSPNDLEFDRECRRLLNDISYFDVLRSDKSISSNGLEPRTPFLDRDFIDYYLSIPISIRNPMSRDKNKDISSKCEKYLLRQAFSINEPTLLPSDIIWRTKEAFSDGVSGDNGSWFKIIENKVKLIDMNKFKKNNTIMGNNINIPTTGEQTYYRKLYDVYYPNTADNIPYFWMPKYVDATDSSARTLDIYNHKNNIPLHNLKKNSAVLRENMSI